MATVTAQAAVAALVEHGRAVGPPASARFDNDTIFRGAHRHPDVVGRVTRLCLSLGVVPVSVPPREPGSQAAVENCNGRWQAKVWARFAHESLARLQAQSARYVAASRLRAAARIEAAPPRRPAPRSGLEPPGPAAGSDRLPEADRCDRWRRVRGPPPRGRGRVAPSLGSCQSRSRCRSHPVLRLEATRSDTPAPVARGGVHLAAQALHRVTGSCCHLPWNLRPPDRELLSSGP